VADVQQKPDGKGKNEAFGEPGEVPAAVIRGIVPGQPSPVKAHQRNETYQNAYRAQNAHAENLLRNLSEFSAWSGEIQLSFGEGKNKIV
jgi:hypothetical protein